MTKKVEFPYYIEKHPTMFFLKKNAGFGSKIRKEKTEK